MEDEGQRAEELGPFPEHPCDHGDLFGRIRDRVAADRLEDRLGDQLAGGAQIAADDHAVGGDQIAEPGEGDSDLPTGLGDQPVSRNSSWVETGSPRLAPSCSAMARADATVSRQPRLPQRQIAVPCWAGVWPISPAVPPAPSCRRPPSSRPAPTPEESLM